MVELIDIASSYPLIVKYVEGVNDQLMVVFSGVGHSRRKPPKIEFFGAATTNNCNHVLFISDESRSWLNSPGIDAEIIGLIKLLMEEHSINNLVLLGNSMGATMALLLSPQLPTNTTIALTPQYSVHPDVVPAEARWSNFRKNITEYKYKSVELLPNTQQQTYIVHGSSRGELVHALRFPEVQGYRHFILRGYGHALAARLKQQDSLTPLIASAMAGRPRRFKNIVQQNGGMWRSRYVENWLNRKIPTAPAPPSPPNE
ncbi:hypothetical protein CLV80_101234 [Yoonia maritima]|uniref:Alpha/beta hydrolase family protein n=1 Tax=Yoonia maritima TaxID=1435347 RepID=A0A2T0W554_9RHOB|nr:hypothetical protein [Yoonia maritima]PRY80382.1 hypothetical protein CLV80_101234 [Yoonia maritima]